MSHRILCMPRKWQAFPSLECFPCISVFQVCINSFINGVWQIVRYSKHPSIDFEGSGRPTSPFSKTNKDPVRLHSFLQCSL